MVPPIEKLSFIYALFKSIAEKHGDADAIERADIIDFLKSANIQSSVVRQFSLYDNIADQFIKTMDLGDGLELPQDVAGDRRLGWNEFAPDGGSFLPHMVHAKMTQTQEDRDAFLKVRSWILQTQNPAELRQLFTKYNNRGKTLELQYKELYPWVRDFLRDQGLQSMYRDFIVHYMKQGSFGVFGKFFAQVSIGFGFDKWLADHTASVLTSIFLKAINQENPKAVSLEEMQLVFDELAKNIRVDEE